ncbi:hypothetical protein F3J02_15815 [Acinetobacter sp. Tr-809]|nr:hypothetical protein [Acinetobacter sp. Tr-809]
MCTTYKFYLLDGSKIEEVKKVAVLKHKIIKNIRLKNSEGCECGNAYFGLMCCFYLTLLFYILIFCLFIYVIFVINHITKQYLTIFLFF